MVTIIDLTLIRLGEFDLFDLSVVNSAKWSSPIFSHVASLVGDTQCAIVHYSSCQWIFRAGKIHSPLAYGGRGTLTAP